MIVKNHLFKSRVPLMNAALDAYALRQKTIAKNVANVNTPHYKPEEVRFEEHLERNSTVLRGRKNSGGHLNAGSGTGYESAVTVQQANIPPAETYHSGETHVNIDKEMSELARNQIRMRFTSQMLGKYFRGLSSAITGQASQS
ncbi:MAG: flagellar basal body rod protein FlgB [Candidatus Kapabacteria bacterium]|nr:flagellar basal body rod protein FlgB [Ignavibacteriota bacterium]MCW5886047.1 flagellar basal body rod protein FlgB [Candidatus Kapabacteria bacterium]